MGKMVKSSFRTALRSSCRSYSEMFVVFRLGLEGDSGVEDNDKRLFSIMIDRKAYGQSCNYERRTRVLFASEGLNSRSNIYDYLMPTISAMRNLHEVTSRKGIWP